MSKDPNELTVAQWLQNHHEFVVWWRDHRDSGYAENRDGRARWGMHPYAAWKCERYRVEYANAFGHYYAPEYRWPEANKWPAEQARAEEKATALAPTEARKLAQKLQSALGI